MPSPNATARFEASASHHQGATSSHLHAVVVAAAAIVVVGAASAAIAVVETDKGLQESQSKDRQSHPPSRATPHRELFILKWISPHTYREGFGDRVKS
jgi:hypothetical protein